MFLKYPSFFEPGRRGQVSSLPTELAQARAETNLVVGKGFAENRSPRLPLSAVHGQVQRGDLFHRVLLRTRGRRAFFADINLCLVADYPPTYIQRKYYFN